GPEPGLRPDHRSELTVNRVTTNGNPCWQCVKMPCWTWPVATIDSPARSLGSFVRSRYVTRPDVMSRHDGSAPDITAPAIVSWPVGVGVGGGIFGGGIGARADGVDVGVGRLGVVGGTPGNEDAESVGATVGRIDVTGPLRPLLAVSVQPVITRHTATAIKVPA